MTRKILSLLFVFAWLLTACKPASSTQAPPTETAAQLNQPTAQATTVTQASQPGCTVVSRTAETDPTGDSPIPEISEQDWVIGPPDAYVTIIEYGDFQ